jgi:hypothetical protein
MSLLDFGQGSHAPTIWENCIFVGAYAIGPSLDKYSLSPQLRESHIPSDNSQHLMANGTSPDLKVKIFVIGVDWWQNLLFLRFFWFVWDFHLSIAPSRRGTTI